MPGIPQGAGGALSQVVEAITIGSAMPVFEPGCQQVIAGGGGFVPRGEGEAVRAEVRV